METIGFSLSMAPTPSKKAAFVFQLFWLDNKGTFQLRLSKPHVGE
jgi:hypothetical protein